MWGCRVTIVAERHFLPMIFVGSLVNTILPSTGPGVQPETPGMGRARGASTPHIGLSQSTIPSIVSLNTTQVPSFRVFDPQNVYRVVPGPGRGSSRVFDYIRPHNPTPTYWLTIPIPVSLIDCLLTGGVGLHWACFEFASSRPRYYALQFPHLPPMLLNDGIH